MSGILPWHRGRVLTALLIGGALIALPPGAEAASCENVVNPYEGTRYEGVDLTRIRAEGVHCPKARRVVRRAHRKALGLVPDVDGSLEFRWNGWEVVGNLRPSHDRYAARREGKRVRWRF